VTRCISLAAYTGEIGDGKIFISPVAEIVRMCATYLPVTLSSAPHCLLRARWREPFSGECCLRPACSFFVVVVWLDATITGI
jgi:hypothetical protein